MTKAFYLLATFFFMFFAAQAQKEGQPLADSLEQVLARTTLAATERVDVLTKLAWEYRNLLPKKAIAYGEQAEKLAKENHYEKKLGEIYYSLSTSYNFYNDIIKSYEFALMALKFNTEYQVTDLIPISKLMVLTNNPNNTDEELLNSLFRLLPEVNSIKDKTWYIRSIGGVGNSFLRPGRSRQADSLIHLAIAESKKYNQKFLEMHNVSRVGDLYFVKKNYDSAIYYQKLTNNYFESIKEKRIFSENLVELAECYLFKYTNDPKPLFLDSAQIFTDLGVKTCIEIGYQSNILDCYNLNYKITKLKGNWKNALEYLEKFRSLNDSINGKNVRRKLAGIALKQRDEIGAAQLKIKDAEVARQKFINYVSFAGIFLILVIAFIIYRNLKKQRALNKKLEETQQQLIASERLAAFGSVATRMAHEIQNPLNFVNNFSELSQELAAEILAGSTETDKKEAAETLLNNLEKINHHGKRASAIVQQLQEHHSKGTLHDFFDEKNPVT